MLFKSANVCVSASHEAKLWYVRQPVYGATLKSGVLFYFSISFVESLEFEIIVKAFYLTKAMRN